MKKAIGQYLDEGSLRLFAQQLIESVAGAWAVGLYDIGGRLIWAGPEPAEKLTRGALPPRVTVKDGKNRPEGYRKSLSDERDLYVFLLKDNARPSGALGIVVNARESSPWSSVLGDVKPIMQCLERQLAINLELSAVRRLSVKDQKDLQLVLSLDEIETSAGVKPAMRSVLELSRNYFGCEMAAVILPQLGVQEVSGVDSLQEPAARRPLLAAMGNLLASAKVHRKVLLANGLLGTGPASGPFAEGKKVLCCPVANARDEIVGIFVLVNHREFARRHIRLARAIGTKLAVLAKNAGNTSGEKLCRHGLIHHIDSTLKRHPDSTHALLYLDVDKLHVVNDSFGHRAGDAAIAKVGSSLEEHAGADEAVAHLSGDRFAFFVRDCDESQATGKAETILNSMRREAIEHEGKAIDLSVSIGIAMIPTVAQNGSEALSIAEVACRSAKDRGGSRTAVFRDLDASMVQRRLDLEQVGSLQTSLLQNRFALYGQAIKPLQDEKAVHRYEILIRLQGTGGEILAPSKVLPAAERYKMMPTLDRWVIRRALEQLSSATNTLEISLATFCINISGQSLADDTFSSFVEARIHESGVSPDSLCFEITETAAVRNLERARRFITQLRKLGCRFALDDFGTGYSSFAYLKSLPVQYIKVDGVFIRDLLENRLSEAIVSACRSIAKVMGAATVAEQVENELVMQKVRALGIDYAQGYVISRPRPLGDILKDIDNQNDLDLPALLAAGS